MKSTRRRGSLALKRQSGCSATLLSYYAGMEVTSEAKLPIYQKPSMAHRVTWHIRLLRQLKHLTASKDTQKFPELYRYDALSLLSCMTLDVKNIHSVVHHNDRLFMVLDYPETLEMQPKRA